MSLNISIKNNSPEHDEILSSSISKNTKEKAKVTHIKEQANNQKEHQSAIRIQKHVRGYLTRKPLLSRNLYSQYNALCEKAKDPESCSMPKAIGGKTNVYLPKEMLEVILKASGKFYAIERYHQMQEVKAVLTSQNSSHLIIPKARLCQEFLVEERLPINTNKYHNMELYLANPDLFDEAVREFTRLFSKIYIGDLVSYQIGRIENVEDSVRYDNLPLYIKEKNGKKEGCIGLIDLEHTENSPNPKGLETLVRIFPLHLDIIKEEASKLKMDINNDELQNAAERGKKYLQVGFTDHLALLKQKGISTDNPFLFFDLSSERMNELTDVVEKELLKLNQGDNDPCMWSEYIATRADHKPFFTQNPEEAAKEIAKSILPLMVDNIKSELKKSQSKFLDKNITESEMLALRSPLMHWDDLYTGVTAKMRGVTTDMSSRLWSRKGIAQHLFCKIIQDLVKGKELFLFDPGFYTGGHQVFWLRY